jgi:hypothetical protein
MVTKLDELLLNPEYFDQAHSNRRITATTYLDDNRNSLPLPTSTWIPRDLLILMHQCMSGIAADEIGLHFISVVQSLLRSPRTKQPRIWQVWSTVTSGLSRQLLPVLAWPLTIRCCWPAASGRLIMCTHSCFRQRFQKGTPDNWRHHSPLKTLAVLAIWHSTFIQVLFSSHPVNAKKL